MSREIFIAEVKDLEKLGKGGHFCPVSCPSKRHFDVKCDVTQGLYWCEKYSSVLGSHNISPMLDRLECNTKVIVMRSPLCEVA